MLVFASAGIATALTGCTDDNDGQADDDGGDNTDDDTANGDDQAGTDETEAEEDSENENETESLEFAAADAWVADTTLSETGYEETIVETLPLTRTSEVGGEELDVEVLNQLVEYQQVVDLGPLGEQEAARQTVLTTPQVEIQEMTFNPIDDMSNEELAEMMQTAYEDIQIDEEVDSQAATMLDQETEVSKFAGTADFEGYPIDIYLHLATVDYGEDVVVAVGVYPQLIEQLEEANIVAMIEGVEHAEDEQ